LDGEAARRATHTSTRALAKSSGMVWAMDLDSFVPVILGDVRQRESSRQILVTLLEHLITNKNLAQ
jgi:hypothetical protein